MAAVFSGGGLLHGGEQGGRVLRARYRQLLVEDEKRHTADDQTSDVGIDPGWDPALMRRPPRRPEGRILEREQVLLMFGQGLFIALIVILSFA